MGTQQPRRKRRPPESIQASAPAAPAAAAMVGKDGRQIDRVEVTLRRHGHLAATVGPTEMIVFKHDKYVKLPPDPGGHRVASG